MADRYPDFATLAAAHDHGKDYRITVQDRGTRVVILAPHGGMIEPETASIARAVAGDDLSFYLFEALRALRKELAEEAQVPPYVVFHDSTLREMAGARPGTLGELGRLPGIGAKKLEAYGERFLRAIDDH